MLPAGVTDEDIATLALRLPRSGWNALWLKQEEAGRARLWVGAVDVHLDATSRCRLLSGSQRTDGQSIWGYSSRQYVWLKDAWCGPGPGSSG